MYSQVARVSESMDPMGTDIGALDLAAEGVDPMTSDERSKVRLRLPAFYATGIPAPNFSKVHIQGALFDSTCLHKIGNVFAGYPRE